MTDVFSSEAEMVAAWLGGLGERQREDWTVYPETAGWDLLLVHRDGYQLGIEAKLSLNAKVLDQALSGHRSYWDISGPDYRAVLVPSGKVQLHLGNIARALGIKILTVHEPECGVYRWTDLPNQSSDYREWPNWCPGARCALPDYVPDVSAGCAAPVQLTHWKIKAIKLMILLARRGSVTRRDMKELQISPTRWCDHFNGYLSPNGAGGYVANSRTPDLRAQHPVNFAEIEADFATWGAHFEGLAPSVGVQAA